ncbi:MAG TPA: DUF4954 family protein [Calditrichaeota bacterium]|nr:DUF4954 family protein [Calditrichota bacterium]
MSGSIVKNKQDLSFEITDLTFPVEKDQYRPLKTVEISRLVSNGNHAEDWKNVFVKTDFDSKRVNACRFYGTVYIGNLGDFFLEADGLCLPVGLSGSTISNAIIGDNIAIYNVRYLAGYSVESNVILYNVDELITQKNSTFGVGYTVKGNDDRNWLEICNENGGRAILPFPGMLTADAWLWTQRRNDKTLQEQFIHLIDRFAKDNHLLGRIGANSVVKNSRSIKNAMLGTHCTVEGVNRIENVTIQSSAEEPTKIRDGIELTDSIIGYGNTIQFGVKAFNVVTGRNVKLNYGARVMHNVIGPNSTISCCEVLSNLLFAFHEQHHNNSFLIATTIGGQANIAAGATIGSNHNSRAADGEIIAARGFWPGLVSNLKHNCVFAPFTLLAKGNYNAEMNITLPFTLLSVNETDGLLQIFPAYWFKYNMYALARNTWKFAKRDKRKKKEQHIETDFLAPDTVESMLKGIKLLHELISQTVGRELSPEEIEKDENLDKAHQYFLSGVVNKQKARLLKPAQGIRLYRMLAFYYGTRALTQLLAEIEMSQLSAWLSQNYREPDHVWHNVGGQLIADSDLNVLLDDIRSGKINSWQEIHERYNLLWEKYPHQKQMHGLYTLLQIEKMDFSDLTPQRIIAILQRQKEIAAQLRDWAFDSRSKDFSNPFRQATYLSQEEMNTVLITPEEDPFLNDFDATTKDYFKEIEILIEKINT